MDSLRLIGNATMVLRLGAFTLLTDPNFIRRGQYAYLGWGLVTKRLVDPSEEIKDLPPLDAVVLSHLHGDHFDRVARRELDRTVPLLTTPQAAHRLGRVGFATHGLETWESHTLERDGERLTVESLPGIHARGVMRRMLPQVMGSLITHHVDGRPDRRLYISGDTLTGDHLDQIAERHPGIDAGVLHLGGTRVLLQTVTMDDQQGVDAMRRVGMSHTFAVHHDDYGAFRSPIDAFTERARRLGLDARISVPTRGTEQALFPMPEQSGSRPTTVG